MKKSFLAIIIAFSLALALCGCNSAAVGSLKAKGSQNTDFAVLSQGGSAVQYGDYVYFINGYDGYGSSNTTGNVFGKVTKGALYRAKLNGNVVSSDYVLANGKTQSIKTLRTETQNFVYGAEGDTMYSDFVMNKVSEKVSLVKNDDGEYVRDDKGNYTYNYEDRYYGEYEQVSSKVIGTSGYKNGGLFIFGNYIYFASPNTQKNSEGTVSHNITDFFRTSITGSKFVTEKLFTTDNESNASEYAFYKLGAYVYLVVKDGSNIKSVKISDKKGAEGVSIIAKEISNVYMPVNEIYYEGMPTGSIYDYVYFTRAINDKDAVRSGNVVEMIRPDGEARTLIESNGYTTSLLNVSNGYLFYQTENSVGASVKYTNLHNVLIEADSDYAEHPFYDEHVSGVAFNADNISDYTSVIGVRANNRSNEAFALCIDNDGMYLFGNQGNEFITIYEGKAEVYAVSGNNVFFGDGTDRFAYVNLFTSSESNEINLITEKGNKSATFVVDIVAGHVMFFGDYNDLATDYSMFLKINGVEGSEPVFIGERLAEDIYDPDTEVAD